MSSPPDLAGAREIIKVFDINGEFEQQGTGILHPFAEK
jgi:hypothetical protein